MKSFLSTFRKTCSRADLSKRTIRKRKNSAWESFFLWVLSNVLSTVLSKRTILMKSFQRWLCIRLKQNGRKSVTSTGLDFSSREKPCPLLAWRGAQESRLAYFLSSLRRALWDQQLVVKPLVVHTAQSTELKQSKKVKKFRIFAQWVENEGSILHEWTEGSVRMKI